MSKRITKEDINSARLVAAHALGISASCIIAKQSSPGNFYIYIHTGAENGNSVDWIRNIPTRREVYNKLHAIAHGAKMMRRISAASSF